MPHPLSPVIGFIAAAMSLLLFKTREQTGSPAASGCEGSCGGAGIGAAEGGFRPAGRGGGKGAIKSDEKAGGCGAKFRALLGIASRILRIKIGARPKLKSHCLEKIAGIGKGLPLSGPRAHCGKTPDKEDRFLYMVRYK